MRASELASRLAGKRRGQHWACQCPAHEDQSPSLRISTGQDGRVLLRCYAGCSVPEILDALDLGWGDLFPESTQAPAPRWPMPPAFKKIIRAVQEADRRQAQVDQLGLSLALAKFGTMNAIQRIDLDEWILDLHLDRLAEQTHELEKAPSSPVSPREPSPGSCTPEKGSHGLDGLSEPLRGSAPNCAKSRGGA